jgi:hypothetical protein
MIKESTNTSTLLLLQELMIEGKIKSLFDANNDFSKDKDLAMMKDILGVGTWDISDNNLDYAIEAWQTIALAAVTMGAWAIAARVALAAVKYWSTAIKATKRGTGIVSSVNKLSTGWKIAKWGYKAAQITKWGLKTWVEWFAFYEGSNLMTNVLLPDRELFENVRDRKEIAKSAAFVWVLKWLWTAFSKLNLGGNANTLINTNGLRIWAPKALVGKDILQNFGKILVQGWMLTGTSQWLEFVFSGFDEDGFNTEAWNPTWEEFIQACLLSRMAEGAGKLPKKVTFKKRGKTIELVDGGKNKIKDNWKNKGENSGKDKGWKEKQSREQKTDKINNSKEIKDLNNKKNKLDQEYKDKYEKFNDSKDATERANLQKEITENRTKVLEIESKITKIRENWNKLINEQTSKNEIKLNTEKNKLDKKYLELFDKFNKSTNAKERASLQKEITKNRTKVLEIESKITKIKDTNNQITSKQSELEKLNKEINEFW